MIVLIFQVHLFKRSVLMHIGVGVICMSGVLSVWAYENQALIKSYIHKRRQSIS